MTAKRLKRPRDPVQLGKLVGDILTGQVEDRATLSKSDESKDQAAVALGRKGGLKGGKPNYVLDTTDTNARISGLQGRPR